MLESIYSQAGPRVWQLMIVCDGLIAGVEALTSQVS